MNQLSIPLTLSLPSHRISDLIVAAIQYGSAYWLDEVRVFGLDGTRHQHLSSVFGENDNIIGNCKLVLVERLDDGPESETVEHELDLSGWSKLADPKPGSGDIQSIIAGLTLMIDKYPAFFAAFITETDDIETADVFLQLCLLGEVKYG